MHSLQLARRVHASLAKNESKAGLSSLSVAGGLEASSRRWQVAYDRTVDIARQAVQLGKHQKGHHKRRQRQALGEWYYNLSEIKG